MNAGDKALTSPVHGIEDRIEAVDWRRVAAELDGQGAAAIEGLITSAEYQALASLYPLDALFRSTVVMARHGFGRGEYRYFAYPLPELIGALREAFYRRLVPMANRWHEVMGMPVRLPDTHAEYIARCHAAGQRRSTPLVLKYGVGDYNCLHQDVYGEQVFPLQVVVMLSQPDCDFGGGEFVMTEQRPRMQSRAMVLPLCQGDVAVIAVCHRPVQGMRGVYRVNLRHGVSQVRSGHRYSAGIIFHDAT
jgi:uncharacterized protein